MASKQEVTKAITVLRAAYPRQAISTAQFREMVAAWSTVLDDVPGESLEVAVENAMRNSKWFPSVAEIRDAATSTSEMQEAADRRLAWELQISWGCCHNCWTNPCHCDKVIGTDGADVPLIEVG
jgi:hypothetical protein